MLDVAPRCAALEIPEQFNDPEPRIWLRRAPERSDGMVVEAGGGSIKLESTCNYPGSFAFGLHVEVGNWFQF